MAFKGTCQDMCPQKERQARFGLYMSIFERDQNNEPSEYAMVKEYRRSGADQEEPSPEDLRTVEALELTMNHLARNIMDDPKSKQNETAIDWYDFLWDRLRAIRKDITQQNICDQRTVILVERCARFHVHSCYALNRVKDFDVNMNKRNLNDCLQMLRQMYTDTRTNLGIICDGEIEFQKYDILLHLYDDQLSSTILMKTSDHRNSSDMKFIFKVFTAITHKDYYQFFKLLRHADYMTSCILSLYVNRMRILGLTMLTKACSPQGQKAKYPITLLVESLGFDNNDDLKIFVTSFGFELDYKNGEEYLVLSRDRLPIIEAAKDSVDPIKSHCLVEGKMHGLSVGQLIYSTGISIPEPIRHDMTEQSAPMDAETTELDTSNTHWFHSTRINEPPMQQDNTPWPIFDNFTPSQPKQLPSKPTEVNEFKFTFRSNLETATMTNGFKLPTSPIAERFSPKPVVTVKRKHETMDEEVRIPPPQTIQNSFTPLGTQPAENLPSAHSSRRSSIHIDTSSSEVAISPVASNNSFQDSPQIERTAVKSHPEIEDATSENIKQLERQVVAIDSQVFHDDSEFFVESLEPLYNEQLARAIQKRAGITAEQLADRMPAGRIQTTSLASRRPTLRLPDNNPFDEQTPFKRKRVSLGARQRIDSMGTRLKEECEVNKILQDVASILSQ